MRITFGEKNKRKSAKMLLSVSFAVAVSTTANATNYTSGNISVNETISSGQNTSVSVDLNDIFLNPYNPETGEYQFNNISASFYIYYNQEDYLGPEYSATINNTDNYVLDSTYTDTLTGRHDVYYDPNGITVDGETYNLIVDLENTATYSYGVESAGMSVTVSSDSEVNTVDLGFASDINYSLTEISDPTYSTLPDLEGVAVRTTDVTFFEYSEVATTSTSYLSETEVGVSDLYGVASENGVYELSFDDVIGSVEIESVGYYFYYDVNPDYTAYVSPVPETSTVAMLFSGIGMMGFVARRKKKVCLIKSLS